MANLTPLNAGGLLAPFREQANPLLQALTAIGQFPQQQAQAQQQKLALQQDRQNLQLGQQTLDERKNALDQQRLQNAQSHWNFIGQNLVARPDLATKPTPELISTLNARALELGIPSPIKNDGTVDLSAWQTPWSTLPPAQQEKLRNDALEREPGPAREAVLSGLSGVPPELRTAPQSFSAKDQAALMRAKAAGLKAQDEEKLIAARSTYLRAHAAFLNGTAGPMEQKILADAQRARTDASADMMKAQAAQQQAQSALQRAAAYTKLAAQGGTRGQSAMRASAGLVLSEKGRVQNQIDGLAARIQTLSATSDDPDNDPMITQLQQQMQTLQQQSLQLQDAADAANEYIAGNLGTKYALQAQSGVTVKSVDTVGGGVKRDAFTVGQTYVDGSGHRAKYLGNGKWQTLP